MTYMPKSAKPVNPGYVPKSAVVVSDGQEQDTLKKGVLESVTDFILPNISNFTSTVTGAVGLGKSTDELNQTIDQNIVKSKELIKQAKETDDPELKNELLEQSRLLDSQQEEQSTALGSQIDQTMLSGDISEDDLSKSNLEFATERGLGVAGEAGVFLIPQVKGFQALGAGSTALQRIAQGAKVGAASGALLGATSPTADSFDERLQNTAFGGLSGWALGGLLTGGYEGVSAGKQKVTELMKPAVESLKNKVGRQQLASFLGFSDATLKKANNLGIDIYDELVGNDLVDGAFARVKDVKNYVDEYGTTKSTKFKYQGQVKANNLMKAEEKKILKEVEKQGQKVIIKKSKIMDGLDDFIDANTVVDAEAQSTKNYVRSVLNKEMPRNWADAGQALDLKRKLYDKAGVITDRSSVKRQALERMAQMVNRAFKGQVSKTAENSLRKQQVLIFLRDEVIPKAGRTLYKEGEKSLFGLSPAEIYSIGRNVAYRAGAGTFVGGPAGAIVGAASTIPEVASKVVGPENIAGSFLRKTATQPQTTTTGLEPFLTSLGLLGGISGSRTTQQ